LLGFPSFGSEISKLKSLSVPWSRSVWLSAKAQSLIVLRGLAIKMAKCSDIPKEINSKILGTIFKDNNGALILVTNQRLTNRTMYFHIRWHHFWYVINRGNNKIVKVNSAEQRADDLTKGLTRS
jgi:hypothetical protein